VERKRAEKLMAHTPRASMELARCAGSNEDCDCNAGVHHMVIGDGKLGRCQHCGVERLYNMVMQESRY
jgi:hypothetical protein